MSSRIMRGLVRLSRPFISDRAYLRLLYRVEMGRTLDLNNPVTMNEKLQWLKLNNRYARLTDLVDKIKVKQEVAKIIGEEHIIPTLAVWDTPEQMDFSALPEKVVVKTNHSGGNTGVAVVTDKSAADPGAIRKKMAASLRTSIYRNYGEWPYKDVDRKIFAEQYLGENPVDYKFYCFNGHADVVLLCIGRETGHTKFYFFNERWELCRHNKAGKAAPEGFTVPKPEGMDEMFRIAARLSEGFPFVRVDLYNIKGRIYFGELTFFPASGLDANRLPEADRYFGEMIDLSIARKEE